ncbi:MAG: radical SAM family heme chaperone HemW [Parabacteroides sp.]|nr:radical SAM family heme chaperone HemW [Parabacteroides sp.]
MAGIYIHVPFCARRCLYCDFFSNTDRSYKEAYLRAIIREAELRQGYLAGETVETVYFGGGTPSQLQAADFRLIFDRLQEVYNLSACNEITLEANPDDLTPTYLESLKGLPFNRLSMGIQSFKDADLRFLNRRHTAAQSIEVVSRCREQFDNISIDLMYGLPGQTLYEWEKNLETAVASGVNHISAYHLIYEEGTALYALKEAGKVIPVSEETSVAMFSRLIDVLTAAGFVHYEISNFGKPGYFSRHNSSYWTGRNYLGMGPSAHSFNGESREWNVSSLPAYMAGIEEGIPDVTVERLDLYTRYNEFVITGLRTMEGISMAVLEEAFGRRLYDYCRCQAEKYLKEGLLQRDDNRLKLTRQGIFVSDGIMSDLLWV